VEAGAGSGGREDNDVENREWLMRCHGWRVYGPGGEYIGVVVEVFYDFSARWDRPGSLEIRNVLGHVERIAIEAVASVDPAKASLQLRMR
jgi:hypothetical protein